ncbi:hypothetical protein [uncultured Tyzzerella sp.]|nr:hypothetical protein [uncultured Tyzzerella sp.]
MEDLFWSIFKKSGDIDVFLAYKEYKEYKDKNNDKEDNKNNY